MGESKQYMTLPEENGSINISEEVIAAIAVGAVRDVEGVSGMMTAMGGSVTDLVTNKKNRPEGRQGCEDRHDPAPPWCWTSYLTGGGTARPHLPTRTGYGTGNPKPVTDRRTSGDEGRTVPSTGTGRSSVS